MPHSRFRHLEPVLKSSLKFSPIVGLFGHRQVGKTTLASRLGQKYRTLDDSGSLDEAMEDPERFLRQNKSTPLVIDECQMAPPLFPAMKEWVRQHPQPGQLFLTGSVRFSSRKPIRESLTGRIVAWELLPMDLSEAHSAPLPDVIPRFLKSKTVDIELKKASYFSQADYLNYLDQGGLPGIFSILRAVIRDQRFETQINAILERDLQLVLQTSLSYRTLRAFAVNLALSQGQPLEWSHLSRQSKISVPTLKKLIAAFESTFLIRIIPSEGTEKKPILFFEDQGEATFLASNRYDELTQLTRFLYSQLRLQTHYRPDLRVNLFQYRNRGGAIMSLCFRSPTSLLGVMPILEENPSKAALASARSFLKSYKNAKVIFVHLGAYDKVLNSQMRVVGAGWVI